MAYSFAVLTVSDTGAKGTRIDTAGEHLLQMLAAAGFTRQGYAVVPDEIEAIASALVNFVDTDGIDLVITCGGTGVNPRDVTPEATATVIDRQVPGIAEIMRHTSFQKTPFAILSRGIAGIRGKSLIINVPGSLRAARENLEVILAALPHAIDKIKGDTEACGV